MENRMKEHQLTEKEIDDVLLESKVGHLATNNSDGYPYVVPVHFSYSNKCIFIHGLKGGTKLRNITNNSKVCFEVSAMEGLILDEKACEVNTKYQSVIIFGKAEILEDTEDKIEALNLIVSKYTPQLAGQQYPENMLKATGIIKISVDSITGKFYK